MPATSPKSRLASTLAHSRLVTAIAGAVAASLVWLLWLNVAGTTPDEARARREAPNLPPPTATVQQQLLRQVAWHGCQREDALAEVTAPPVPSDRRPVVTSMMRPGAPVRTGSRLGSVGGVPILAIVTERVLYRDLVVGDSGPDIAAFNAALDRAGIAATSGATLSGTTVARWRGRVDRTSPPGRVRISTLIAVPPGSTVRNVEAAVGDLVRAGARIAEVGADSGRYRCQVPDSAEAIRRATFVLERDGEEIAAKSLVVRPRTPRGPASAEVVPAGPVTDGELRLGFVAAAAKEPVLSAPLSAVRTAADGKSTVTLFKGGSGREVKVALGISAQGWVEIRGAGIGQGDKVVLFDPRERLVDEDGSPS